MSRFDDDLTEMTATTPDLEQFLDELRALADVPSPEPSEELAAVLSGERSAGRLLRGRSLTSLAVAATVVAMLVIGAATHQLPGPAQRLVSGVVNVVTPFHIDTDARHAQRSPTPPRAHPHHAHPHHARPHGAVRLAPATRGGPGPTTDPPAGMGDDQSGTGRHGGAAGGTGGGSGGISSGRHGGGSGSGSGDGTDARQATAGCGDGAHGGGSMGEPGSSDQGGRQGNG
ncbi:MAG: hypothetical protein ACRDVG_05140 [Jatrophihabitantaceae bacterium]